MSPLDHPLPPLKPFARSYPVIPGKVWGGCYPGDRNTGVARRKIIGLINCGVRVVINLMEADERGHGGAPFAPYQDLLAEEAAAHGVSVDTLHFPIGDGFPPERVAMTEILETIDRAEADAMPVFFHCWGGVGRTGTVAAVVLIHRGIAEGMGAIELVNRLRHESGDPKAYRRAPERGRQVEFVLSWGRSL